MTKEEVNILTQKAIYVFKELLEYENFKMEAQVNETTGTQYQFKQISALTGVTEIYITPVSDRAKNGEEINGLKIDNIRTSTTGIGIGSKLIAILSKICDIFELDLCLWSKNIRKLKKWYRKLGFKEVYTNSLGETLFMLERYNFKNAIQMLGVDEILKCSKIGVTIAVAEKYLNVVLIVLFPQNDLLFLFIISSFLQSYNSTLKIF
jgi:hypothetical protein